MADVANDKKETKKKAPAKSKKGSSILDEAKAVFKDLDTSDGRKLRKRAANQIAKAPAAKKTAAKGKAKGGAKKSKKEEPAAAE